MDESITKRLADLTAKLNARRGKPGYESNCNHLQAEIDRLTARASAVAET